MNPHAHKFLNINVRTFIDNAISSSILYDYNNIRTLIIINLKQNLDPQTGI